MNVHSRAIGHTRSATKRSRRALAVLAGVMLLASCGDDSSSNDTTAPDTTAAASTEPASTEPASSEPVATEPAAPETTAGEAACIPFESDEGSVCVPADAERIVAANYFSYEILKFLGVEPVAVTGIGDLPEYLGGGEVDLPDIGTFQEPNLEAIAALEPDLIFGNPGLETTDELAGIAVFVAINTQVPVSWQEAVSRHAEALGLDDAATAAIDDYDTRVAALAESIGNPADTEVSLVSILAGDGVGIIGDKRTAGALLLDVGFSRPEPQQGIENFEFPSPELFAILDGDVMLVNAFGDPEEVERLRAELEGSPLYPTLAVVQAGNVMDVGVHWFFHGPIAAQLMLTDLEAMYG
jgi:iron complex transport system substrate-binding protein